MDNEGSYSKVFIPPFLRAINSLLCPVHSRPVALFLNSINQVYFFFILSNLFFNYFFVCFNPIFSSYLDLRFFHPFLVDIPEGIFPASISPQISMKCLTLASH